MQPRVTRSSRRAPAGALLGTAVTGAVLVAVLAGTGVAGSLTAATAAPETGPVSVAEQVGLAGRAAPVDPARGLAPLEQLAASRSSREAAQTAAQQAQAAADTAELERRRVETETAARLAAEAEAAAAVKAEAEAEAQAEATAAEEAAEAASAAEAAAEEEPEAAAPAAAPARRTTAAAATGAVSAAVARITNRAGSVAPQVQAAADQVVSAVPGAAGLTLGGTRASAADPGGHPSGLALDYMVLTNAALGDAITRYLIEHWSELGVAYVIWEQRMLSSPGGSWKQMEDRGGVTENHFDHVHVDYR
ncbi:hypothetical protein GCU67_15140 [Modestobacter muralis]|uniref:ARB-07466-like C-terminal domain-containing protein n=1 Tax=Modestobacter muralis TaxID=1608614 RepID=A0A6P0EY22_9ACTN|nr:hypothetical protein [Modestobacter muralis]NEK95489.1 hypothetical protein [Modestobacter muralis]NEN52377.1 hypothetical protein [Modestobacter muralis]